MKCQSDIRQNAIMDPNKEPKLLSCFVVQQWYSATTAKAQSAIWARFSRIFEYARG